MDSSELRSRLEGCQRESYGWALCCCSRDAAEAENVLQAAYLKVLEGKARFDGRAAFKTWLFAVIRRTAIDLRRREMLRRLRLIRHTENSNHRGEHAGYDEAIYQSEVQAMFQ